MIQSLTLSLVSKSLDTTRSKLKCAVVEVIKSKNLAVQPGVEPTVVDKIYKRDECGEVKLSSFSVAFLLEFGFMQPDQIKSKI